MILQKFSKRFSVNHMELKILQKISAFVFGFHICCKLKLKVKNDEQTTNVQLGVICLSEATPLEWSEIEYDGCATKCPDTYEPVCAWNETAGRVVTMQNICVLRKEADCLEDKYYLLEYQYDGKCRYSLCADNCHPAYNDDWRCGYNAKYELYKTFGSNCELKGWNKCSDEDMRFEILYDRECGSGDWRNYDEMVKERKSCENEKCEEEYRPVCVANFGEGEFKKFITYPRNCTWQRRNLCTKYWHDRAIFVHDGECNGQELIPTYKGK